MTYLIFTKALEPSFSIYSSATAIARGSDSLTITVISYVTRGKNAWNIRHGMFNWDDISDVIHVKDALKQFGIRLMPNSQEEPLHR